MFLAVMVKIEFSLFNVRIRTASYVWNDKVSVCQKVLKISKSSKNSEQTQLDKDVSF